MKLALAYGQSGRRGRAREAAGTLWPGDAWCGREPAFLIATMTAGRPLESKAVLAVAGTQLDRVRRYLEAAPEATDDNQP